MGWCMIMLKSDMFETYDWAPYPIVLFQFLQYHSFLVFSSNAISLFHWHLNYNCFTREEDCIKNIFFALKVRLAITRLLLLVAHILLLTFLTGSK